jgi:hypothetical protein
MQSNTKHSAEWLQHSAVEAGQALREAEYQAQRAALLVGSVCVGCDDYSSQFFRLDRRPPAELQSPASFERSSLHRLPNGDWLEILRGSASWVRHTYDRSYALDRARRKQLGGYVLRSDVAAACRAVIEAGAHQIKICTIWDHNAFSAGAHVASYSAERSLYADEQAQRWIACLREARDMHPGSHGVIDAAIAALSTPDALRAYPAPIDAELCALIREIEAELDESATA